MKGRCSFQWIPWLSRVKYGMAETYVGAYHEATSASADIGDRAGSGGYRRGYWLYLCAVIAAPGRCCWAVWAPHPLDALNNTRNCVASLHPTSQ